jgi:hypothetical protein
MAKLIDPDDLNQGTEVVIVEGSKTIQLLVAGNLVDTPTGATSGVTGKAFYSFLKEEWKSDVDLNKFRFPLQMIYEAQFIWINGWTPADDQTRDLIRDAGFLETDGRENACIISLGAFNDSTDFAYYSNVAGLDQTTLTFDKPGELNENIQIKGTGGTPDNTGYFKAFLRAEQDLYSEYNLLSEQGLAALTYQAYRLPLSSVADSAAIDDYTVVGTTDVGSVSGVTYSEMAIDYIEGTGYVTATVRSYVLNEIILDTATPARWYRCTTAGTADVTDITDLGTMPGAGTAVFTAFEGERQIGTDYYAFNRIIDADDVGNTSARIGEIHSWAQYQLSLSSDINDNTTTTAFGTVNGDVARLLTGVVAGKLNTSPGVFVDNYDANDKNDINFFDITVDGGVDSEYVPNTSTQRNFPFVAAGNLNFSQNLYDAYVADNASTKYTMYFTNDDAGDNAGADFDTASAIIVKDNGGTDITGNITAIQIGFDFDFTSNIQRGAASAGEDAPITIVAIAHDGAQWIESTGTISEATGLVFNVNANDELNYSNP